MWVDIRMLLGCWALWAKSPDHSSPTWREDHERLFSQALDSLMYYARRWVKLEVVLADRMHFGSDDEPLITLARHAGPGRLARHRLADGAHRGPAAAHRARRGAALGPGHRHHPQPARLVLRALGLRRRRRPRRGRDPDGRVDAATTTSSSSSPRARTGPPAAERATSAGCASAASSPGPAAPRSCATCCRPRPAAPGRPASARPEADVMVLAHAGLARLSTPRMIWEALPFDDRPLLVKTWTYAADHRAARGGGVRAVARRAVGRGRRLGRAERRAATCPGTSPGPTRSRIR